MTIQTCNTEGPALQKDLFPFWPPPPNTPQDTPAPTSFQHGLTWFLGSFPMCFLTISVALSNSLFLMQTITACRGKQGQFEAGHREQLSANFHTDQLPHHCRHEFADNEGMPHMRQLPPSSTQDLSKAKLHNVFTENEKALTASFTIFCTASIVLSATENSSRMKSRTSMADSSGVSSDSFSKVQSIRIGIHTFGGGSRRFPTESWLFTCTGGSHPPTQVHHKFHSC